MGHQACVCDSNMTRQRGARTKIMLAATGTHSTVEMSATLALCQAWSWVDAKCCLGALPLKLPPKNSASAG